MFTRIVQRLRLLWARWFCNPFIGVTLPPISERDLRFDADIQKFVCRRSKPDAPPHAFISYMTIEDYNKDFIVFYRSNRSQFCLDHSHNDGHFRV